MGRTRRASIFILSALCATVMVIPAARADKLTATDGNDSRSALDIEKVVQGHEWAKVRYRVVTFDKWDPVDLDNGRMVFAFNTDNDSNLERRAILRYVGGGGQQMRAPIVNSKGESIGRAVIRRPSGYSVEIYLARWQLGHPKHYRMFVNLRTKDSGACVHRCHDRAPNAGAIRHTLHDPCGRVEPTITGTKGDDVLRGTKGNDVIAGLGGDDQISGIHTGDSVCGGPGDDVIEAERGYTFLRGGRGADLISGSGPKPAPCDDTGGAAASCAYPEALFNGGPGPDRIFGGRRHELLLGGSGNDVLRGRRWSDRLEGGPGHDTLWGGPDEDYCKSGEELHSC